MNATRDAAALVGRVLLALMFVLAGYDKIGDFEGTIGFIASKGLPLAPVGAGIALAVELVGGTMLVVGWKARWAALVIATFAAAATYFFHDFWNMTGPDAQTNQLLFLKNAAVIGGLLTVWAFGPGRYSLDRS